MKSRHLVTLGLLMATFARGAIAGGVVMYGADERPDPRAVAAILSRTAVPPGVKMRSIRLLDGAAQGAPAEATKDAPVLAGAA